MNTPSNVTPLRPNTTHDVIPLLNKAGAVIADLVGRRLEYEAIDLRNPCSPIIYVRRPVNPLATFPEGITYVRPCRSTGVLGSVKIGDCYIRWEEEGQCA